VVSDNQKGNIIREHRKETKFRKLWNRAESGNNKEQEKEIQNRAPKIYAVMERHEIQVHELGPLAISS
jgi:hypothetical protein